MNLRQTLTLAALALTASLAHAADILVYKSPTCGCCSAWVEHMQQNGFSVETIERSNMHAVKEQLGVPYNVQSCHTAVVGGYLVEGHVPATQVQRLLRERPAVRGLAVPGMPMGSPGMEGPRKDAYDVVTFQEDGVTGVYSQENR